MTDEPTDGATDELSDRALKIPELEEKIVEALEAGNGDSAAALLAEYLEQVKGIRMALCSLDIPVVRDPRAVEIIRKIASGEPLPLQAKLLKIADVDREFCLQGELSDEEENKVADMLMREWGGPWFHAGQLYTSCALVLGVHELPPHLAEYVKTARLCYVLEQYLAVCVLCRTILEICVHDLYRQKEIEKGLDPRTPPADTFIEFYKMLRELVEKGGHLWNQVSRLRDQAKGVVHPPLQPKPIPGKEAMEFLGRTFSLVHELYSRCGK